MQQEKRKSRRRKIGYPAQIATSEEEPIGCILLDVSETGARIGIDPSQTIPDTFTLLLSRNGEARRHVEVVWREEGELGLRFVRPTPGGKAQRPAVIPAPPMVPDDPSPAETVEPIKLD